LPRTSRKPALNVLIATATDSIQKLNTFLDVVIKHRSYNGIKQRKLSRAMKTTNLLRRKASQQCKSLQSIVNVIAKPQLLDFPHPVKSKVNRKLTFETPLEQVETRYLSPIVISDDESPKVEPVIIGAEINALNVQAIGQLEEEQETNPHNENDENGKLEKSDDEKTEQDSSEEDCIKSPKSQDDIEDSFIVNNQEKLSLKRLKPIDMSTNVLDQENTSKRRKRHVPSQSELNWLNWQKKRFDDADQMTREKKPAKEFEATVKREQAWREMLHGREKKRFCDVFDFFLSHWLYLKPEH